MWTAEDDVVLSAVTYYIGSKTNNKTSSLVNTKFHSDQTQFQLAEGDAFSKNCGQIFITINHLLVFHCAYCDKRYGTLFYFLQHISAKHLHGQKKRKDSEISTVKENATKETPITELVSVQGYLPALEVNSEFIVDDDPSLNKKTKKKPEIKEMFTRQNEKNEEETIELEQGDIDSEKGHQDECANNIPTLHSGALRFEHYLEVLALYHKIQDSGENIRYIEFEEPSKNPKSYKKSYKKTKKLMKCDKCDKIFSNNSVLKSHLVSHSNARDYSCPLCARTFKHKCNLSQHMIRHTSERKYKCKLCDKLFFTQIETTIHQRSHAEDRPHVCFKCGDAFKCTSNLFQHMRRRHDNIRSAKCDICELSFFDRSQLKLHMVVHSSERPFVCTYCSASFKRRYHLHQHMKSHLNAKEYECNLCEKTFNLKYCLKTHIKINHDV